MSMKDMNPKAVNREIVLQSVSAIVSVGLCQLPRYGVHLLVLEGRAPLEGAAMTSMIFAFLALAFGLYFTLKATRPAVDVTRAKGVGALSATAWLTLLIAWVFTLFCILLWLWVFTGSRWLAWTTLF